MDHRGGRKKRQVVKTPGEVVSWFKRRVDIDSHATLSVSLQLSEKSFCDQALVPH